MGDESQNTQVLASLNKAINDFNSLKIRLDTEPLLDKFEAYLRGNRTSVIIDNGEPVQVTEKIGEALCNTEGCQNIMRWVANVINNQAVQGNFPVDKHGYSFTYEEEVREFREEFGQDLVLNIYDWGIEDEKAEGIIDMACQIVRIYLSRLIGNEERKSYGETMRTIESNVQTSKGGMQLFKGK